MHQSRRRLLASGVGGLSLLLSVGARAASTGEGQASAAVTSETGVVGAGGRANDGRHDFDFYFGRWDVRVRRLREAFVGSDEWIEYDATDESRSIIGGLGCIDEFITDHNGGLVGMALRLFDPETRLWSVYWASSRSGRLDAPVVGRFKDGIGEFIGKDVHEGRPMLVRNLWRDIEKNSVRWEQAASLDDGKTWETNCVMLMRRRA